MNETHAREIRRRRRDFIRAHHPDRGGDTDFFTAGLRAFDTGPEHDQGTAPGGRRACPPVPSCARPSRLAGPEALTHSPVPGHAAGGRAAQHRPAQPGQGIGVELQV